MNIVFVDTIKSNKYKVNVVITIIFIVVSGNGYKTFNINGLKTFYYQYIRTNSLHHWTKGDKYSEEQAFFHSVQDAITWCQKQGKEFTIYDPKEI